jgi:tetratricopeptide (TPR) repeat protein
VPHSLRPTLAAALALVLAPCCAHAQDPKPKQIITKVVPNSETQKPDHKPVLADYPQEPFVYESVRGVLRYENDGTGYVDITAKIHVQSLAGLERIGQLIFSYNSANERQEVLLVRVTKPDGREIKAGPEALQDLSAPVAHEAPMYSDLRQVHVTVPGLTVGDTLEFHQRKTITEPLTPGEFWNIWRFEKEAICLDEQVELNVPADRKLKLASPDEIKPTSRVETGRKIYHWQTSHTVHDEKLVLLFKNEKIVSSRILFSTYQDWEAVGKWWTKLEAPRREATPEIRAKADEITHSAKTDLEKVETVYEWVQRNIRYVSLSFGVGRYQPHAAAEVLANAYGDCKDKTTLIDALLDAENLRGAAALTSTEKDFDDSVPMPQQFNHAINTIWIGGKQYWFDSTAAVAPFGYLVDVVRDKKSLIAYTDRAPELGATPKDLPWPTKYEVEVNGKTTDQTFDGTITARLRGDYEFIFRELFLQIPGDKLDDFFKNALAAQAKSGSGTMVLTGVKVSDPLSTREPLQIGANLKFGDPGDKHEGRGTYEFADLLQSMLPEVPVNGIGPASPIALNGPMEITFRGKFESERAIDEPMPRPAKISRDFAEFEWDSNVTGKTATFSWRINFHVAEIPVAKTDDYAAFRREVLHSLTASQATASMSASGGAAASAHRPLPDALDAFNRAQASIKSGELGDAIESLQSAVDIDRDYSDAWELLGETTSRIHDYPRSESALRKAFDLAPNSEAAVLGLTQVLLAQNKMIEAADFLRERVKEAPDDGQAHFRLGTLYLNDKRTDDAAVKLERAAALLPKDAGVQLALGDAYFRKNDSVKASAAMERAASLDGTPQTLNTVAYAFADHKVHLDHATGYAEYAVRAGEEKLNAATLDTPRPDRALRVITVAAYWDTLGWVKFQQRDLKAAEKYLRAACDVTDDATMTYHLGRVLEDQGKKQDAIAAYVRSAAYLPPVVTTFRGPNGLGQRREATPLSVDDQSAAMRRLIALVGGADQADDLTSKARGVKTGAVAEIPNEKNAAGSLIFEVILTPGPSIEDISSGDPSSDLAALADKIRSAKLAQTFPDEGTKRIPLIGLLTCEQDKPCHFRVTLAAFVFPTALTGP